jgi:hypothetical protein
MRFTHEGMLVKSIDVPDVEATAVPEEITPVVLFDVMVLIGMAYP